MEITYFGLSCFRLRGRDAAVVADPIDRSAGYALGRVTADIVTVSNPAREHITVEAVGGSPKVIRGPGEYEIKGVFIQGIATSTRASRPETAARNTAYVVEIDGLNVCHLGELANVPTEEQIERLENLDVLLVPVGGHGVLDATKAAETVSLLEPKIVVPMYYHTEESRIRLDPVDRFLKEMGVPSVRPEPKLTVTRSSVPEATTVMLLEHRH
ncbi:MAG: MBL fold metallo-hydrolase [Chloroflexi bacterium]|nr:MBL fold metallo-hydrolase [Chloroflexota bacterium]